MTFTKDKFIDFLNTLDISYIEVELYLQGLSKASKTVDVRTGAIYPPMPFRSETLREPQKLEGEITIVLGEKGGVHLAVET